MRASVIAIFLCIASPACANEVVAYFKDRPSEVISKISAQCIARRFEIERLSDTDIVCQGDVGDADREFKAKSPPEDPRNSMQMYHRFTAHDTSTGAEVKENTTIVYYEHGYWYTFGLTHLLNYHRVESGASGVLALKLDARIKEFLQSLGGQLSPTT
jgi:hypothetical protein